MPGRPFPPKRSEGRALEPIIDALRNKRGSPPRPPYSPGRQPPRDRHVRPSADHAVCELSSTSTSKRIHSLLGTSPWDSVPTAAAAA